MPGASEELCVTCQLPITRKHHFPIPNVLRCLVADKKTGEEVEVTVAVCGKCYKWANRHFSGDHQRCRNGDLGDRCRERFDAASSFRVRLVTWDYKDHTEVVPKEPRARRRTSKAKSPVGTSDDYVPRESSAGRRRAARRQGLRSRSPIMTELDASMGLRSEIPRAPRRSKAVLPSDGTRVRHTNKRPLPSPAGSGSDGFTAAPRLAIQTEPELITPEHWIAAHAGSGGGEWAGGLASLPSPEIRSPAHKRAHRRGGNSGNLSSFGSGSSHMWMKYASGDFGGDVSMGLPTPTLTSDGLTFAHSPRFGLTGDSLLEDPAFFPSYSSRSLGQVATGGVAMPQSYTRQTSSPINVGDTISTQDLMLDESLDFSKLASALPDLDADIPDGVPSVAPTEEVFPLDDSLPTAPAYTSHIAV